MTGHLDWEQLGGRALTDAEQAHARDCPACREEVAGLLALRSAARSAIPVDLAARVQLAAASELARRPRVASWRGVAWVAAGLAAAAALPALMMPLRADWSALGGGVLAANAALLAAVFSIGAWLAFRPSLQPGLIGPSALALIAGAVMLATRDGGDATVAGLHPGCLTAVVAVSLAPFGALLALLRGQELSRRRGALAGLAAGALGEIMVCRHCGFGNLEHLLGAHLAGWVVLVALGGWLGERARIPLWPASRSR